MELFILLFSINMLTKFVLALNEVNYQRSKWYLMAFHFLYNEAIFTHIYADDSRAKIGTTTFFQYYPGFPNVVVDSIG